MADFTGLHDDLRHHEEFLTQLTRRRARSITRSRGERLFDAVNVFAMLLLCVATIYPFWYALVLSFNDGRNAAMGPLWIWPREFTLDNYVYVLNYPGLHTAFLVTLARVIVGPVIHVAVCLIAAYALSKRYLPGRRTMLLFFIIPMFIGGTTISFYVVNVRLGLLNNFLVYVIPGAFGFFTMVIMRTFIEGIPLELEESVFLDGGGYGVAFSSIVLPLSKAVIAAFLFFQVVNHWLDFYTTLLFITRRDLRVLQFLLYEVIHRNETQRMQEMATSIDAIRRMAERQAEAATLPTPQVVKMAVMVAVTAPLLFIYPFFQKHFVKGMMIGSIKA